jgi:PAS domain S-box-containing protein
MARIAFIAPDKTLLENSKRIAHSLGLFNDTDFYYAQLNDAVTLARSLEHTDVDVIISRYGSAYLMMQANLDVPVIDIQISGQDLAQAFYDAKKSTGLAHPRLTYMAFGNMANDILRLSKVLDIDLKVVKLRSSDDIYKALDQLSRDSLDVLIGGAAAVAYASSLGFTTQLVQSGDYSLRDAFSSAQKLLLARSSERTRTEEMRTIINAMREGIICVNKEKKIRFVNYGAEFFLQQPNEKLVGHHIDEYSAKNKLLRDCMPFINDCLENGTKIIDKILKVDSLWINFNFLPIIVKEQTTGAAITIQDITQIQEMEIKIRNEVVTKKFIAKYHFEDILGNSPEIMEAKRMAQEFADVDTTVLISGESGTGKELFAQSIHNASKRANGPFVAINCAALPTNLLESELFGYVDGAFTGARRKGKSGLFEMAHRGTIFLDEISEMDPYGQSRLLRVLQERQVMRLGDDKYIPIDVRIIAATNKKLPRLVQRGKFRQDLFYRLKVLTVTIPPLRQREGDIIFLARHFLSHYVIKHQRPHELDTSAEGLLTSYNWPGNVRELRYFIERLIILAREPLITETILQKYWEDRDDIDAQPIPSLMPAVQNLTPDCEEKLRILEALNENHSNISKTAAALSMDRSTLYRKLKSYKIIVKKAYD